MHVTYICVNSFLSCDHAILTRILAFLRLMYLETRREKIIILKAADVWCLSQNATNGHAEVVTHVEVLVTSCYNCDLLWY